jgi:hypothetical protein
MKFGGGPGGGGCFSYLPWKVENFKNRANILAPRVHSVQDGERMMRHGWAHAWCLKQT